MSGQELFSSTGSRIFLPFTFSISFRPNFPLGLSEEVSGYSYCWCWLLINRVPSYQPMHDWPFSTKQGGNKEGEEESGR